jgi:titin
VYFQPQVFHFNLNIFFSKAKPDAISGKLRTSDLGQDSVKLSWQTPLDDGGSPITRYILESRDTGSRDWKPLTDLPAKNLEYVVKDLVEGEEYEFRIMAENSVGRSKPVETESPVKPYRDLGT